MPYKEIEVRFLDIDQETLVRKLTEAGAVDRGEDILRETIFYDQAGEFKNAHKFIRIREGKAGTTLTYKYHRSGGKDITAVDDVDEIETDISDPHAMKKLLEALGFEAYRQQEKRRHSFVLGEVLIDIDEWPGVPAYVELEGTSEATLRQTAEKLGLSWSAAYFGSARDAIEKVYGIPVSDYHYFTFKKTGN